MLECLLLEAFPVMVTQLRPSALSSISKPSQSYCHYFTLSSPESMGTRVPLCRGQDSPTHLICLPSPPAKP